MIQCPLMRSLLLHLLLLKFAKGDKGLEYLGGHPHIDQTHSVALLIC